MNILDLHKDALGAILAQFPTLADRMSTLGAVCKQFLELAYACPIPDLDFDQPPISFYTILFRDDRWSDTFHPTGSVETLQTTFRKYFGSSIVLSRITLGHVLCARIGGPIPLCAIDILAEKFPFLEDIRIGKLKPNSDSKTTFEEATPFVDTTKPFLKFRHLRHVMIDDYTAPDLDLPFHQLKSLKIHLSSCNNPVTKLPKKVVVRPSLQLLDGLASATTLESLDVDFFCPLGHFSKLNHLAFTKLSQEILEEIQRVKLPNLTSLHLRTADFKVAGWQNFVSLNHFANSLKVFDYKTTGREMFSHVEVEKLDLGELYMEALTVAQFAPFARNTNLRVLHLSLTQSHLRDLDSIRSLVNLTDLSLVVGFLTKDSFPPIEVSLGPILPQLVKFSFRHSKSGLFSILIEEIIFDAVLSFLSPKRLVSLQVDFIVITSSGCMTLSQLTNLSSLSITYTPGKQMVVDDEWLLNLRPLRNLHSLSIFESSVNNFSERIAPKTIVALASDKPLLRLLSLSLPIDDEDGYDRNEIRKVLPRRTKLVIKNTFEVNNSVNK